MFCTLNSFFYWNALCLKRIKWNFTNSNAIFRWVKSHNFYISTHSPKCANILLEHKHMFFLKYPILCSNPLKPGTKSLTSVILILWGTNKFLENGTVWWQLLNTKTIKTNSGITDNIKQRKFKQLHTFFFIRINMF